MSKLDDVAKIAGGPVGYLIVGAVAIGAVYVLYKVARSKLPQIDPAKNAVDSCGNPETSYEAVAQTGALGAIVGELGAATNAASGGWLATLGCKISRIGCNYDPNAPNAGQLASPVSCSDPIEGGYIFADRMRRPKAQGGGSIPTSNQRGEEVSGAIQTWSARPYQSGNHAAYAAAFDASPPDPTYTLNVLVTEPLAGYKGN
jgi:hypothetical protein